MIVTVTSLLSGVGDATLVGLSAVAYFAVLQAAFYRSAFTTAVLVAFVPVTVELLWPPVTRPELDHLALAGVCLGTVATSLAFGRAVVARRSVTLAVTVGFAGVTWAVVARGSFGEDAVWYHLLATPLVGVVAVASLSVGG